MSLHQFVFRSEWSDPTKPRAVTRRLRTTIVQSSPNVTNDSWKTFRLLCYDKCECGIQKSETHRTAPYDSMLYIAYEDNSNWLSGLVDMYVEAPARLIARQDLKATRSVSVCVCVCNLCLDVSILRAMPQIRNGWIPIRTFIPRSIVLGLCAAQSELVPGIKSVSKQIRNRLS